MSVFTRQIVFISSDNKKALPFKSISAFYVCHFLLFAKCYYINLNSYHKLKGRQAPVAPLFMKLL